MRHTTAVIWMLVATLLWSIAGVITRHIAQAESFEISFWRSAFTFLSFCVILPVTWGLQRRRGTGAAPMRRLKHSLQHRALWLSAICWSGMFTSFMVALTRTSVANVLVTSAITPLITAVLASVLLKQKIAARTWLALGACVAGIAYMYSEQLHSGVNVSGSLIALLVPLSAACNWTVIQSQKRRRPEQQIDMVPAVMLGALLSALYTLPLAIPFQASGLDLMLLCALGVFQLAIPCMMVVQCQKILKGPEVALLSLMEIIFGITWAWIFVDETPNRSVLFGGLLVLVALTCNEAVNWIESGSERIVSRAGSER